MTVSAKKYTRCVSVAARVSLAVLQYSMALGQGGPGGPGGPRGGPGGNDNTPQCATDGSSASVSTEYSTSDYLLTSSGCPPYDWSSQSTPGYAGEQRITMVLPRAPTISKNPIYLNENGGILGPVGITTFGVPLFNALDRNGNNAYEYEGATFDQCYGHAAGTQYHLHTVPGSRCCVPGGDAATFFAVMADGIPVSWPEEVPEGTELDECNGFVNPRLGFYHYVATSDYPYTAKCLRGCVLSTFGGNNQLSARSGECDPSDEQYDYRALHPEFVGDTDAEGGILRFDASPLDSSATVECASGAYSLSY